MVTQQVEALVSGSITAEQFDAATDTASVIEAIDGAVLNGVLLPDGVEGASTSNKDLAIGLGVGLGLGLPLLAAASWWAFRCYGRRRRAAGATNGGAQSGLQEAWIGGEQQGPQGAAMVSHPAAM
jgi:hypothetical protein